MRRTFLCGAALLIAGLGLGLGLGAWRWRGAFDRGAGERTDAAAKPAPPAGPVRPGAAIGSESSEMVGTADRARRLEALAAKFRGVKESRGGEERVLIHVDAVMGLAGLTSKDLAQLMSLLSEPSLDVESAMVPLMRWVAVDPMAALEYALSRDELRTTERILAVIVYEMAGSDLPSAKAALSRMEAEERRYSQRAIVRRLQQTDPVAALAYARESSDAEAERDVLKYWAKSDPAAAAAEFGAGKPDQNPAVEAIATALASHDRSAFETWAAGLTDPTGRAIARRAALVLDTLADPEGTAAETAAWLSTDAHAQESAGDLPVHVAQRWWSAKAAPGDVAAWAASLPAGKAQDTAVGEVARLWVDQDLLAASEWLGTLPPSPSRDQAVRQLVWKVSKEAPDEAFEWASTMQEGGARNEMLGESLRAWARSDPAAAQAAVATLPPEQHASLLELISREQRGKK